MAWSRFTYWKRGNTVPSLTTKPPAGSNKPLVYHQVMNGDFDPSPFLDMVEEEDKNLAKEVAKWKKNNKYSSSSTFTQWYRERKAVYNKRKGSLEKAHWDHDEKRMLIFKKNLKETFHFDMWEELLENESIISPKDFYFEYERRYKERISKMDNKLKINKTWTT